ncbi:MAG: hypothetical protein JSU75_04270 [Gammaproteobacteria bacterium]|nr:MAG: hypothetical protein JSU75_04270 [Gammaproteobacteria bacterium]
MKYEAVISNMLMHVSSRLEKLSTNRGASFDGDNRTGINDVTIRRHRFPVYAVSMFAFALGMPAWGDEEPNEISECDVFIEINATDEDAGWQGILDASPWRMAQVIGPDENGSDGKTFLKIKAQGEARKQGITEYRWESAEPTFDDFALEDFLDRFPAGEYTCSVTFIDGHPKKEEDEDELTHCLPDGPVITDPGELPAGTDWTVMWGPVTTQYDGDGPGLGAPLDECDPEDELVKYNVTVEFENGFDKVMNFDVMAPASMAVISGDFLECGLEGKVEIGAFLDSGNSTFREIEIATSDCP